MKLYLFIKHHHRTISGSAGGVVAGCLLSFFILSGLAQQCSHPLSRIISFRLVPRVYAMQLQQCTDLTQEQRDAALKNKAAEERRILLTSRILARRGWIPALFTWQAGSLESGSADSESSLSDQLKQGDSLTSRLPTFINLMTNPRHSLSATEKQAVIRSFEAVTKDPVATRNRLNADIARLPETMKSLAPVQENLEKMTEAAFADALIHMLEGVLKKNAAMMFANNPIDFLNNTDPAEQQAILERLEKGTLKRGTNDMIEFLPESNIRAELRHHIEVIEQTIRLIQSGELPRIDVLLSLLSSAIHDMGKYAPLADAEGRLRRFDFTEPTDRDFALYNHETRSAAMAYELADQLLVNAQEFGMTREEASTLVRAAAASAAGHGAGEFPEIVGRSSGRAYYGVDLALKTPGSVVTHASDVLVGIFGDTNGLPGSSWAKYAKVAPADQKLSEYLGDGNPYSPINTAIRNYLEIQISLENAQVSPELERTISIQARRQLLRAIAFRAWAADKDFLVSEMASALLDAFVDGVYGEGNIAEINRKLDATVAGYARRWIGELAGTSAALAGSSARSATELRDDIRQAESERDWDKARNAYKALKASELNKYIELTQPSSVNDPKRIQNISKMDLAVFSGMLPVFPLHGGFNTLAASLAAAEVSVNRLYEPLTVRLALTFLPVALEWKRFQKSEGCAAQGVSRFPVVFAQGTQVVACALSTGEMEALEKVVSPPVQTLLHRAVIIVDPRGAGLKARVREIAPTVQSAREIDAIAQRLSGGDETLRLRAVDLLSSELVSRSMYPLAQLVTARNIYGLRSNTDGKSGVLDAMDKGAASLNALFAAMNPDALTDIQQRLSNLILHQFSDVPRRSFVELMINAADSTERHNKAAGNPGAPVVVDIIEKPTNMDTDTPGSVIILDHGEGISREAVAYSKLDNPGETGNAGVTDTTGKFGAGFLSILSYLQTANDRVIIRTNTGSDARRYEYRRNILTGELIKGELPLPESEAARIGQGTEIEVISFALTESEMVNINQFARDIVKADRNVSYYVTLGNRSRQLLNPPDAEFTEVAGVPKSEVIAGSTEQKSAVTVWQKNGDRLSEIGEILKKTKVSIAVNGKLGFGSFEIEMVGNPEELILDFDKEMIDYARDRGEYEVTALTMQSLEALVKYMGASAQTTGYSGAYGAQMLVQNVNNIALAGRSMRLKAKMRTVDPGIAAKRVIYDTVNSRAVLRFPVLFYDPEIARYFDLNSRPVLFVSQDFAPDKTQRIPDLMRDSVNPNLVYMDLAKGDKAIAPFAVSTGTETIFVTPQLRAGLDTKLKREQLLAAVGVLSRQSLIQTPKILSDMAMQSIKDRNANNTWAQDERESEIRKQNAVLNSYIQAQVNSQLSRRARTRKLGMALMLSKALDIDLRKTAFELYSVRNEEIRQAKKRLFDAAQYDTANKKITIAVSDEAQQLATRIKAKQREAYDVSEPTSTGPSERLYLSGKSIRYRETEGYFPWYLKYGSLSPQIRTELLMLLMVDEMNDRMIGNSHAESMLSGSDDVYSGYYLDQPDSYAADPYTLMSAYSAINPVMYSIRETVFPRKTLPQAAVSGLHSVLQRWGIAKPADTEAELPPAESLGDYLHREFETLDAVSLMRFEPIYQVVLMRYLEHAGVRVGDAEGQRKALETVSGVFRSLFKTMTADDVAAKLTSVGANSFYPLQRALDLEKSLDEIRGHLSMPGYYSPMDTAIIAYLFTNIQVDESRNATPFAFGNPAGAVVHASAKIRLSDLGMAKFSEITDAPPLSAITTTEELSTVIEKTVHSGDEAGRRKNAQDTIRSANEQTPDPFAFLREVVTNVWEAFRAKQVQTNTVQTETVNIRIFAENNNKQIAVSLQDKGIGMDLRTIVNSLLQPGATNWSAAGMPHFGQGFFTVFKASREVRIRSTKDGVTVTVIASNFTTDANGNVIDADLVVDQAETGEESGTTVEWVQGTDAPRFSASRIFSSLQQYVGLFDSEELSIEVNGQQVNKTPEVFARRKDTLSDDVITIYGMKDASLVGLNGSFNSDDVTPFMERVPPFIRSTLTNMGIAINISSSTVRALEGRGGIVNSDGEIRRLRRTVMESSLIAMAHAMKTGATGLEQVDINFLNDALNSTITARETMDEDIQSVMSVLNNPLDDRAPLNGIANAYELQSNAITLLVSLPLFVINGSQYSLKDIYKRYETDPEIITAFARTYPELATTVGKVIEARSLVTKEKGANLQDYRDNSVSVIADLPGTAGYRVMTELVETLERAMDGGGAAYVPYPKKYFSDPKDVRLVIIDRDTGIAYINISQMDTTAMLIDRVSRNAVMTPDETNAILAMALSTLSGMQSKSSDYFSRVVFPYLMNGDPVPLIQSAVKSIVPSTVPLALSQDVIALSKSGDSVQDAQIALLDHKSLEDLSDDQNRPDQMYYAFRSKKVSSNKGTIADENLARQVEAQVGVPLDDLVVQLVPDVSEDEGTTKVFIKPSSTRAGLIELPETVEVQDPATGTTMKIRYVDIKGLGYVYVPSDGGFIQALSPAGSGTKVWGLAEAQYELKDLQLTTLFAKYGIRTNRFIGVFTQKEVYDHEGRLIPVSEAIESGQLLGADTPAVAIRAWAVPYRLQDLGYSQGANSSYQRALLEFTRTSDEIRKRKIILSETIRVIEPELRAFTGKTNGEPLTARDYLGWFAETIGDQVGLLHFLGYAHNFFGIGHNITLDARIIDLDTVRRIDRKEETRGDDEAMVLLINKLVSDVNSLYGTTIESSEFVSRYQQAYANATNVRSEDALEAAFFGIADGVASIFDGQDPATARSTIGQAIRTTASQSPIKYLYRAAEMRRPRRAMPAKANKTRAFQLKRDCIGMVGIPRAYAADMLPEESSLFASCGFGLTLNSAVRRIVQGEGNAVKRWASDTLGALLAPAPFQEKQVLSAHETYVKGEVYDALLIRLLSNTFKLGGIDIFSKNNINYTKFLEMARQLFAGWTMTVGVTNHDWATLAFAVILNLPDKPILAEYFNDIKSLNFFPFAPMKNPLAETVLMKYRTQQQYELLLSYFSDKFTGAELAFWLLRADQLADQINRGKIREDDPTWGVGPLIVQLRHENLMADRRLVHLLTTVQVLRKAYLDKLHLSEDILEKAEYPIYWLEENIVEPNEARYKWWGFIRPIRRLGESFIGFNVQADPASGAVQDSAATGQPANASDLSIADQITTAGSQPETADAVVIPAARLGAGAATQDGEVPEFSGTAIRKVQTDFRASVETIKALYASWDRKPRFKELSDALVSFERNPQWRFYVNETERRETEKLLNDMFGKFRINTQTKSLTDRLTALSMSKLFFQKHGGVDFIYNFFYHLAVEDAAGVSSPYAAIRKVVPPSDIPLLFLAVSRLNPDTMDELAQYLGKFTRDAVTLDTDTREIRAMLTAMLLHTFDLLDAKAEAALAEGNLAATPESLIGFLRTTSVVQQGSVSASELLTWIRAVGVASGVYTQEFLDGIGTFPENAEALVSSHGQIASIVRANIRGLSGLRMPRSKDALARLSDEYYSPREAAEYKRSTLLPFHLLSYGMLLGQPVTENSPEYNFTMLVASGLFIKDDFLDWEADIVSQPNPFTAWNLRYGDDMGNLTSHPLYGILEAYYRTGVWPAEAYDRAAASAEKRLTVGQRFEKFIARATPVATMLRTCITYQYIDRVYAKDDAPSTPPLSESCGRVLTPNSAVRRIMQGDGGKVIQWAKDVIPSGRQVAKSMLLMVLLVVLISGAYAARNHIGLFMRNQSLPQTQVQAQVQVSTESHIDTANHVDDIKGVSFGDSPLKAPYQQGNGADVYDKIPKWFYEKILPNLDLTCQSDCSNELNNLVIVSEDDGIGYAKTFIPNNMVRVIDAIPGINADPKYAFKIRADAVPNLQGFVEEMKSLGYDVKIKSIYRSFEHQEFVYENHPEQAPAKPGYSEHQGGLAVDMEMNVLPGNKAISYVKQNEILHKYGIVHPYDWDKPHYFLLDTLHPGLTNLLISAGIKVDSIETVNAVQLGLSQAYEYQALQLIPAVP